MKGPTRELAPALNNRRASKREIAVLDRYAKQAACVTYDFDEDGGGTGDITFGTQLPTGALVTNLYIDVVTAATSGGLADYQLKAGSIALSDATDFDDATNGIDGTGVQSIPLASSATAVKITADSELTLSLTTAALTAGKVRFCVEFLAPEQL